MAKILSTALGAVSTAAGSMLSRLRYRKQDSSTPAVRNDQPLYSQWARYTSPLGLPPKKSHEQLVRSYRSWVYSCTRAIGNRVSSLPLHLMLCKRESDNTLSKAEIIAHPYLDMMWAPSQFSTRIELWMNTLNHLDLCGNAFWLILFDALGTPREIQLLYPQYMRVVPDPINMVKGYIYLVNTPPIRFELNDPRYKIIHFKYPNPLNPYYGMGPLEAQAYAYDLDLYTEVYQRNFFSEGARPDFVLETEQKIQRDDAELIWELWDERHKGVEKAWRPGILGFGMKAKPLNVSNRDLAFAVLADWSRDKMLAAYGVPAAKLGLVADFNRANSEAADVTFNREAILPRCMLIEERIERDLLGVYPGQSSELWLEVDFDNPVPEDRELKLKERESQLNTGQRVINELREQDGLEPVPWGNVPLVKQGTTSLDTSTEEEKEPPEAPTPPKEPEQESQAGGPGSSAFRQLTSEQRDELADQYLERTTVQERKAIPDIDELWQAEEEAVQAALKAAWPKMDAYFTGWSSKKVRQFLTRQPALIDSVLIVVDNKVESWKLLVDRIVQQAVDVAGRKAIGDIGVGEWDVQNPNVLQWISNRAGDQCKNITNTTKQLLRQQLSEGVVAGEGERQLSARVAEVYQQARDSRTNTIARTEVHTASNYGALEGYRQSGVVNSKEWLTAKDERTRASHQKVDGVTIPVNDNFSVGKGSGPAPGQIGRPEEDINCRCTLIPVLDSSAPTGGKPKPEQPAKPKKPKPKKERPISTVEGMRKFLQEKQAEIETVLGKPGQLSGYEGMKRLQQLKSQTGASAASIRAVIKVESDASDKVRNVVNKLTERLQDLTGTAAWKKISEPVLVQELPTGKSRAYYLPKMEVTAVSPDGKLTRVKQDAQVKAVRRADQDSLAAAMHEVTHHIEAATPQLRKMSRLFYESRTEGEPYRPLAKVFNTPAYGREMCKTDKWWHAYQGRKIYPDGCTEILSMTVEQFCSDEGMKRIYNRDPESFAFAWHVLTGGKFTEVK